MMAWRMTANSSSESVADIFDRSAATFGEREFLHAPYEACRDYSAAAISIGYGDARRRIATLASRFHAAGYGPGHRVGIALDNRPEFFLYFLALNSLGISVVPLNAAMTVAELFFVLAHSDVALAVMHPGHAAHVRAALALGRTSASTVALHVAGDEEAAFPRAAAALTATAAGCDEAALLYTSGTTGTPKGCVLTNEYFVEIGRLYAGLGGYCRFDTGGDRLATPASRHAHECARGVLHGDAHDRRAASSSSTGFIPRRGGNRCARAARRRSTISASCRRCC